MVIQELNRKQRLLVIDPSASHLAYVICEIEPGQSMTILRSGMLWTHDKWSLGKRLNYMKYNFTLLMKEFNVEKVYTEQYFMNPKMLSGGTAVIPTINAVLQMCIDELGKPIEFEEIPPPSWRSILSIKPSMTKVGAKTKRDYKEPTKAIVRLSIQPPEQITSNITMKLRDTPYDIYDALAMVLALTKKANCNNLILDPKIFTDNELLFRFLDRKDTDIIRSRAFKNDKD